MSVQERTETNKRMIGKRVYVTTMGGWYGTVESIDKYNPDIFYVLGPDKQTQKVDIFDIRQFDS